MMLHKYNLRYSPDPPDEGGGDPDPKVQKNDPPESIPYDRFQKENVAKKEALEGERIAKEELKKFTDKQEADKLKKLEADGELEKVNKVLSDENEKLKAKAAKYDTLETGIRKKAMDTLIEKLGEEAAAAYEEFETDKLQTVAQTIEKTTADPPAPDDSRGGGRSTDINVQAAIKKYGSKPNIAKQNPDLYDKLWPNPRRMGNRR